MMRVFNLLLVFFVVAGAAVTFSIKQSAQTEIDKIAFLKRQIAQEKDAIDILEADWSYLTESANIQKLVDQYNGQLQLHPIKPTQVISGRQLPKYLPSRVDAKDDLMARIANADDPLAILSQ